MKYSDLPEALQIGWKAELDEVGNIITLHHTHWGISPFRLAVMLDLFEPLATFVTRGANLVITHDDSNAGLYDVEFQFDGTQVRRETRSIY